MRCTNFSSVHVPRALRNCRWRSSPSVVVGRNIVLSSCLNGRILSTLAQRSVGTPDRSVVHYINSWNVARTVTLQKSNVSSTHAAHISSTRILRIYTPLRGLYAIDIAWDRVFYEIYRHEHEGKAPRASCHVYCIKHVMLMFFISRRPLTYRVIII